MNTYGRKFRVTIFGESHGEAVGAVLDGVPAGLELSEADFEADIARRRSGAAGTTPRRESDTPVILSGVWQGHTTGAPLAIIFRNEDVRSRDYAGFAAMPRPGHADLVASLKWDDCNDPRGGGHFSGRLTLPVVAAGVVAKKILADATILDETPVNDIRAEIIELGGEKILRSAQDDIDGAQDDTLPCHSERSEESSQDAIWQRLIEKAAKEGDSLGAVIECTVPSIDPGYGEPFWDSVESAISHAVFSIPGVRGIEFGDGFAAAAMRGSEHNDPIGADARPIKNGAGGINGGLTNGAPILFRVAFKPTSSIAKAQTTFNFETGEMDELKIAGRHDVCYALRCPVVVEAMTSIALADLVLLQR